MWRKMTSLAVLGTACLSIPLFLSHRHDGRGAGDKTQKSSDTGAADRNRSRPSLADLELIYAKRMKAFDEAAQLRYEALERMSRQHRDVPALKASHVQAEKLARKIPFKKDSADLLATLAKMFNEQHELIAATERRRAREH